MPLRQLTLALLTVLPAIAAADEPSVAYIFPAGGQRGTTVQFKVGGHFLHGEAPLEMLGPGVEASAMVKEVETVWFEGPVIPQPASQRKEDYPKDHAGEVAIAADAPLGFRRWRVSTSQGVTPAMKFVVGDLPEVVEEEMDGAPLPVRVTLPVTINGRIFPREDVDVWEFDARAGQTVWCEVCAARLGSPLDARIEVLAPDGASLAENTDAFGPDPFLQFTAPADGTYRVRIHDISFGGLQHYVYRLTISGGPFVESFYPLGGRRGEKVQLRLAGPNVPEQPVEIALPADGPAAWPHWLELPGGLSNRVLLDLDDLPEALEAEPNDEVAQAAAAAWPGVWNGRIGQPGDADVWKFTAKKGEAVDLEVRAGRLGSPLDPVLTVEDADGNVLARSDDAAGRSDSQLTFKPPADGDYFARVTERFASRGGPRFAYRLRVAAAAPERAGFRLTLPADALTVMRGAQVRVRIDAQRLGGYNGPIELEFKGLPPGVTVTGNSIAARRPNAQVTLAAAADAQLGVSGIEVVGRGETGEGDAKKTVTSVAALNTPRGEVAVERLTLGVGLPAPFKFTGVYRISYAAQGTTHRKRYTIERNGYDGPLQVSLADRQIRHLQGVTGPVITVPAGATEFEYAVQLPPWLDVGRTSRTTLMALAEVTDEHGNKHRVSYSSTAQNDQMIVLADPCPLSLKAMRSSLVATPGETVEVRLRVERSPRVQLPLTIQIAPPAHMQGVSAEPVTVPLDQNEAVLRLRFGDRCGPLNMPLAIRATARNGDDRFVAETRLELVPPP